MPRVFKFGGALLKDADGIRRMASLVEEFQCEPMVVVVSAIGKTTNALEELYRLSLAKDEKQLQEKYFQLKQKHIRLAEELDIPNSDALVQVLEENFRKLWDVLNINHRDWYKGYDQIIPFGEEFSGKIVRTFLSSRGIPVHFEDAQCLLITDSHYTNASLDWEMTQKSVEARVLPALNSQEIVLTQGFVAADKKGISTTLGREGSDFTAAILAYILEADEVSIWKDVPGLMNADPRLFRDAVKLPHVSYNEAIELAFYGASVIHPKTIQPLKKKGILLKVCSFYNPQSEPTLINADESDDAKIPKFIVKKNQTLLSISTRDLSFMAEESLKKVFSALSKNRFHINLMQNSAVSFSVIFDEKPEKLEKITKELSDTFILKYNTGLELLTIRHYNDALIKKLTSGKHTFLTQKTRTTVQLLLQGEEK